MRGIDRAIGLWLSLALTVAANAGGPRFVTGPPFFTGKAGVAIGWKQPTLLYYTDPGDLSAAVSHQAADALVAAAARVWNLPVASITVGQGGALPEHVSGQNVYLSMAGLVFPADVMSSNAAAIPVAVIYDADGSVTDLLLGSGASDPSGCRQNAVTESVDSFDPAGYILHAIVVLNGRCTGAAPQLQSEMQYQLMRVFGRVLGLAWSQTNDNMFTGTPTPTYDQAMNWPIMHPLDIICGPYAYQCLPSPFQLRTDDVASMVAVYPIAQNAMVSAGKQASLSNAQSFTGHIYFPTGEGMAGVNVLVRSQASGVANFEGWYEASAVTGATFRLAGTSPFVSADVSAGGSFGTADQSLAASYLIAYVPMIGGGTGLGIAQNDAISTEPVNALYAREYSLGPYAPGDVSPSGSAPAAQTSFRDSTGDQVAFDFTIADAAFVCGNGQDGTAQSPMAVPASGWWKGLLCGYGHASYVGTDVRPNRSFSIEVTALDEQGLATDAKTMPVIGLFAPTDAHGDLPSLGVTPSAFNAAAIGTTTIHTETGQLTSLWFGIADERGDGRPDYNYQARFFYADNIVPAEIASAGAKVTIAGLGFRAGNAVTINGVAVSVISWSANAIVVTAPPMSAVNAASGVGVDVVVRDLSTGANSTMKGALTYTTGPVLPNFMKLVSAPAGTVYVGDLAQPPFAVQVVGSDGVTPVVGDTVVFTAAAGTVQFAACGAATCSVTTDANGIASTGATPESAGAVTMQATDGGLSQTISFTAEAQAGSIVIWLAPSGNQSVGAQAGTPIALTDHAPNNGPGMPGRSVTFSATVGSVLFSGCSTAVCTVTTDASGAIAIFVTPTADGPVTIQAADGDVKATTSFNAISNTDIMTTFVLPTATTYLGNDSGQFAVALLHADGVTPDVAEWVTFSAPTGVLLNPCVANVCAVQTGGSGVANVGVSAPLGNFMVQATFGALEQSAAFSVVPHAVQLQIISAPSGNVALGTTAGALFTAQLLQDGAVPISGISVSLGGAQGSVMLSACNNNAGCRLPTDGNGMVSTQVTPLVPGTITLNAVYGTLVQSATFNATGVGKTMVISRQPGLAGVWVGDPVNFAVRVTGPGGLPLSGDLVTFTITSGSFGYSDWYTTSVTRATDANGIAAEIGIAGAAGTIAITASDGTNSQIITFIATAKPLANQLSITALNPQTYIAEGATFGFTLNANVMANGIAATGQAIHWTAGAGFLSTVTDTVTDVSGAASLQAMLGPLAAGVQARMTACAVSGVQPNACTTFDGTGVSAREFAVSVVSGGQQAATGTAILAPIVALVVDSVGHPVAGASVSIYQTVRALNVLCPVESRCPAMPILRSQATVAISGVDGTVTVAPLEVNGASTQTEIEFAAGTQGFATAVVSDQP